MFKLVYDPLTGNFDLRKVPAGAGGEGGGRVLNGTLLLPGGSSLQFTGGVATNTGGEIIIEPGSEIQVTS